MLSFLFYLTNQFIQLIVPVSEASDVMDDMFPLLPSVNTTCQSSVNPSANPVCQPSAKPVHQSSAKPVHQSPTIPSSSWCRQTKMLLDGDTSKLYQCKRSAQEANTTETESSTDAGHNTIMPKGGGHLSQLPLILSALRMRSFATLLNALCASEKPFDNFQKSSPVFLKTSCIAFESVWPHLKIRVETDNVLFNLVCLSITNDIHIFHHSIHRAVNELFRSKERFTMP